VIIGVDVSDPQRRFGDGEFQQVGPSSQHCDMMTWQGNSNCTLNDFGSQYGHYGTGNAMPGGHTKILGLPTLPTSPNECYVQCNMANNHYG
jgi:hypothetical protein